MAKSRSKSMLPFVGRWRIVSMSNWDQDYVDEEEEGYFNFTEKGSGEFHFGYVHGIAQYCLEPRGEDEGIAWTWEGNDDMDPVHGRGWAVLKGDELHGKIFFHMGEESRFKGRKKKV